VRDPGAFTNVRAPERPGSEPEQRRSTWLQYAGGNGRFAVRIFEDTDLARADMPARDAFERVWEQRLVTRESETLRFLDGGFCLKCRRVPSWGDFGAIKRSGRIVHEALFLERVRGVIDRVPATLAWGEERCRGIPVRSFLLTRLIPSARNLSEFLRTPDGARPDRAAVLEGTGSLIGRLHAAGFYHRDLSTRNLLVEEGGRVLVIDCPRGVASGFGSRRADLRRGDLTRLGRSLLRDGASESEVRHVFASAGVARPEPVLAAARRRAKEGSSRSWRTRLWVTTGI
jgi:tRNA A-37 threonylcarbamoyl transferase component Bud32